MGVAGFRSFSVIDPGRWRSAVAGYFEQIPVGEAS
jgi:hypothetical protein